jgi:hypothetical protein
MGRLYFGNYGWTAAILALFSISACGGHKPAGTSPYPTKITLTPSSAISLQLGGIIQFTATATNGTSNNVSPTFTYISSDTSILNVSARGVACAGHWDITNTICTPGAVGEVQVTASAEGQQSAPTFIFVHAPIDNIVVSGILPTNQYVQEPCLSQGQSMILQATAYSEGTDITESVGPFSWSANNASVVTLTPTVTNFTYNIPTNEAVALAVTPGMTQIFATASGVTSNTFQQPQYKNTSGTLSPVLDFFETCPIQNIALEVGSGSQLTNQTSFVTTKGTSQTLTAVVTDVMGNTSLVGSDSPVILSKTPLTWTSSQPAVVTVPSGCTLSCTVTTPSPGAAVITASCSPPTCNIGYPYIPPSLSTPSGLAACASFFGLASCEQLIPVPVYSSPFCATQYNGTPCPPTTPPLPSAVAGLVTGATSTTSALATSTGCVGVNPIACTTSIYNVSTAKAVAGSQIPLPSAPTSLLFDLAGDRAYMGSEIGAVSINPGGLGSSTSGFTGLGPVTGKILTISNNGTFAIFSDTTLNPNQVFIVNTTTPSSTSVTAFTIQGATAAAFSPDGLKAFIYGLDTTGAPNLYVYSTVQGLQTIPLAAGTTVNSIAFSTNGAFAYVVESSDPTLPGSGPGFRVYNTCQVTPAIATTPPPNLGGPATPVSQITPLSATPISFQALPDGIHFIALEAGGSFDYITATVTGIPAATLTSPASSLCPSFVSNTVTSLNLAQGSIQPLDSFTSPDGSLMYVLARESSSVLVYDFATGSTSAIGPLVGNALPVQAGISADGGTIVVAGNDGYLHVVTTQLGGSDILQIPFPYLPDYLNSYCTFTPAQGPCTLNLMAVNPK